MFRDSGTKTHFHNAKSKDMNKRQMLMNEIRAVLQPQQEYFIRHTATGLFYRAEDYDLSICQPRPKAKGKRINWKKPAEIYRIGGADVFF